MKQKIFVSLIYQTIDVLVSFVFYVIYSINIREKEKNPGIVLSFDDYFPDAWENYFDLFDKYNVKVTFFVTKDSVTQFMLNAQKRGYEIGYHTISHPSLPALTKEQFYKETISCIDVFRQNGIKLTSFAYTFGNYEEWMHEELLKYYKIVRGFGGILKPYKINDLKFGFIDSDSIDNYTWKTDLSFRRRINKAIQMAKVSGKIVILTSHSISSEDWAITPERLEYLLKKAQKNSLTFYTFRDLQ